MHFGTSSMVTRKNNNTVLVFFTTDIKNTQEIRGEIFLEVSLVLPGTEIVGQEDEVIVKETVYLVTMGEERKRSVLVCPTTGRGVDKKGLVVPHSLENVLVTKVGKTWKLEGVNIEGGSVGGEEGDIHLLPIKETTTTE